MNEVDEAGTWNNEELRYELRFTVQDYDEEDFHRRRLVDEGEMIVHTDLDYMLRVYGELKAALSVADEAARRRVGNEWCRKHMNLMLTCWPTAVDGLYEVVERRFADG